MSRVAGSRVLIVVTFTVQRLLGAARRLGRLIGIGAALSASAALLVLPTVGKRPKPEPVAVAVAWPNVKRAAIAADLPDGTEYEPGLFLDADRSVGSAPTRDGKSVRLVLRRANGSVQEIRRLPQKLYPSFSAITAAGDALVWVEQDKQDGARLWTTSLRHGKPRLLTAQVGQIQYNQSEYDLVVAAGRVYWVAAGTGDVTDVRSVALAGGGVDTRPEPGDWKLSAWPWIVNGVTDTAGTTRLRNLITGRDQPVANTVRGIPRCSPTWCRVTRLDPDGTSIDLTHPDGTHRAHIGDTTMVSVLSDPVPLDRFEVMGQIDTTNQLTGHVQLIAYEMATRRLVVISPDAFDVNYRAGVLWWSTGNDDGFVRHTLDLRTI
jgi:hypothetical protein